MDQATAVNKPYYGFETEVYTLLVGSNRQKFYVSADLLAQIPNFEKLLDDANDKPLSTYEMECCEPEGIATILAFFRDGRLPDVSEGLSDRKSIKDQVNRHIKAYEYGKELGLEAVQNAVIDSLCPLLPRTSPSDFDPVFQPDPDVNFDSQMYSLLARQVAFRLQRIIPSQEKTSKRHFELTCNTIANFVGDWQKEAIIATMAHLFEDMDESPAQMAMRDPCLFHDHEHTKHCHEVEIDEPGNATTPSEEDPSHAMTAKSSGHEEKDECPKIVEDAKPIMQGQLSARPMDAQVEGEEDSQVARSTHTNESVQEVQCQSNDGDASQICHDGNTTSSNAAATKEATTNAAQNIGSHIKAEQSNANQDCLLISDIHSTATASATLATVQPFLQTPETPEQSQIGDLDTGITDLSSEGDSIDLLDDSNSDNTSNEDLNFALYDDEFDSYNCSNPDDENYCTEDEYESYDELTS